MARQRKNVAVYARLSQDRNGDSLGIARQRELCEKVAKERGWKVAEVYEERNVSAYSGAQRPEFLRLCADLEAGRRDAVIAVDQDRLARQLGELDRFMKLCEKADVPIVLLSGEVDTTTADGRLRAQILGAVAENESAKKSERIKRQRDQAAKLGTFTGGKRPYGFEADGRTHRRAEVKVLREVAKRILRGDSMSSIVRDLNDRGISAAKGGRWEGTTLRDVLVKPRNAALRVHRGEVVGDAAWKPIFDRETYERLVRKLNGSSRSGRGRPQERLLSGLCKCGKCGANLWAARVNGVRAYRCPVRDRGGCNGTAIVAEPLEELISQAVVRVLSTGPVVRAVSKPAKKKSPSDDLVELEQQLEELAADMGSGRISRREWLAAREPLEQRRNDALASVGADLDRDVLVPFAGRVDIPATWAALAIDRQRALLRVLVEQVVINPSMGGARTFDPDRVELTWRA